MRTEVELQRKSRRGFSWRLDLFKTPLLRPLAASVAVALGLLLVALFFLQQLYPATSADTLVLLQVNAGQVSVNRATQLVGELELGRKLTVKAGETQTLQEGDWIVSSADADAAIAFPEGTESSVGPGVELHLTRLQAQIPGNPLAIAMVLDQGNLRSQVKGLRADVDSFTVSTPNLVANVRGTVFQVDVRPLGTRLVTEEGVVQVRWDGQSAEVEAGQELLVLFERSAPPPVVRPHTPALTLAEQPSVGQVVQDAAGLQTIYSAAPSTKWQIATLSGARVDFYVNDALAYTLDADANGQAIVEFSPPEEGVYRVAAVMQSVTGEQSLPSSEYTVVFDQTAPSIVWISPAEPQVSEDVVEVVGQTEPGASLTINGEVVALDDKGGFSYRISLAPGANELVLAATDRAGNTLKIHPVLMRE